jgi:hypothetical protein
MNKPGLVPTPRRPEQVRRFFERAGQLDQDTQVGHEAVRRARFGRPRVPAAG